LICEYPQDIPELKHLGFAGVSIDHSVLQPSLVFRAHSQGLRVYTWTVNEPADLRRCASIRVDGIITDDPANALRILGT
jgi:glycerophosphoryl diester phosphodiesterase